MVAVVIRSLERVFIIFAGALSIYLGYLLFLQIPNEVNSAGQVILPGGISIYLSRVGPGAFLALFGAIVIALSFHYSIKYSQKEEEEEGKGSGTESKRTEIYYSGLGQSSSSTMQRLEEEREELGRDILSKLPSLVRTNLPVDQKSQQDDLIQKIELALMKSVWASDWGDFADFQVWVQNGAVGLPPETIGKAVSYYKARGVVS